MQRGQLHAAIAFGVLLPGLAVVCMWQRADVGLAAFLICKLAAYMTSAAFHLRLWGGRVTLRHDLLAIPLAICAPAFLFAHGAREMAALAAFLSLTMRANGAAVARQLACGRDASSSPLLRCAVLFACFVLVMGWIGVRAQFARLWQAGFFVYCASFLISPPMVAHAQLRRLALPWHGSGHGWHEDFHVLLAVGDVCVFCCGRAAVCDSLW